MDYGITRIYSPDDGRAMGLQGMINDLVEKSDFPLGDELGNEVEQLSAKNPLAIARLISAAENFHGTHRDVFDKVKRIGIQICFAGLGYYRNRRRRKIFHGR